jgi:2-methylcitrate dehydratase PrpD
LAEALGAGVAALDFGALPEAAVETAKTGFIDCIAVMVAGAAEAPVQILKRTLAAEAGVAEAALYFSAERMPAPAAAWINGTAGHVLDYDDFARGHPSVAIVPAILAEGELLDVSGADLIAAYVAGYEVFIDVGIRERRSYQAKGWHPTPLMGALAAAAACARLRRLDAAGVASALGLAAAQASGITASYGTMAKSMQVGKAAHTGVLSARLAANGMTAAADVLDHAQGFLAALSPAGDLDLERPARIGEHWHIAERGLSIKRYPACYCVHRLVDGALELAAERPVAIDDIARIEVSLSKTHVAILKHHRPQTGLEAKFSAEFAVAAALLAGNVGLREVRDAYVLRPEVQALMARVSIAENENYDPDALGFSLYDQVKITLNDGRTLAGPQVRYALGNAKRPLGVEDLRRKFLDCFAAAGSRLDAGRLFAALQRLETLPSCRSLVRGAPLPVAA